MSRIDVPGQLLRPKSLVATVTMVSRAVLSGAVIILATLALLLLVNDQRVVVTVFVSSPMLTKRTYVLWRDPRRPTWKIGDQRRQAT